MGVVRMKSENPMTKAMIKNMLERNMLQHLNFPQVPTWGALRGGLAHLEYKMQKEPLKYCLIKTWRFHEPFFPAMHCWSSSACAEEAEVDLSLGWRMSMDVKHEDQEWVKNKLRYLRLDKRIMVNPCSRRSWASWTPDKLQAWDITLHLPHTNKDAETVLELANAFWQEFQQIKPLMGYIYMLNFDKEEGLVLLEVSHSDVIRDLFWERWVLLPAPMMAIIQKLDLVDLDSLNTFIEQIKAYNQKSKGTQVKKGGKFVDRVVLNSKLMMIPGVKEACAHDRVFWERHQDKIVGDGGLEKGSKDHLHCQKKSG